MSEPSSLLRAEIERVVGPLADQMLDELVNGTEPRVLARGHAKGQIVLVVDGDVREVTDPDLKLTLPPGSSVAQLDLEANGQSFSVCRLEGDRQLHDCCFAIETDGYEFREDWWPTEEALRLERIEEDLDPFLPPELRSVPPPKPNRTQRRARRRRQK